MSLLWLEGIGLVAGSVLCVVVGTWLIGELSPKAFGRRNVSVDNLIYLAEMKHDLQRGSVRWLSILAASVIGAYKLKDVVDLIIAALR